MTKVKKESADNQQESLDDKLAGIDPDAPKAEDIKNLQKALSAKDLNYKKLESELKILKELEDKKAIDDKKIADEKKTVLELQLQKVTEDLGKMSQAIQSFNDEKRKAELATEYPDILPDFLVGKTDEQVKTIVEKQRAKNKQLYGDAKFFIKPIYESADDIDKEIEAVKQDKSQRGDQGALKVLKLMREKLKFN